jgi:hypothetical protein
MVDPVTDNRNITKPTVGGDSGTWGGILNSGVMDQIDTILGAMQAISMTSADVTLSIVQWNNMAFELSGTLTGDHSLILPFNANSTTVAVGGFFIVDNQTDGAFNVTVKTGASGSTGVIARQGLRTMLFSDTVNVWNADDAKVNLVPHAGNPNGAVAGTAGSVNRPPDTIWDYTNGILYICTTTGTTVTAVWTNVVASGSPLPVPQGYLTPLTGVPLITADVISGTHVYYTPFKGRWAAVHNGSAIVAYQFSQLVLTLSASQAASNIYDIFLAYNAGAPVIGTGPSWSAGGGSVTPGSSSRGSGAGSTAIERDSASGLWVNSVSMSLIYNTGGGNNTIVVPAGQGIYLGSIFIDAVAGQITCHRSYGVSRKWSVYNAYNQQKITLKEGDPTSTWNYTTGTIRISHGNANNNSVFILGLPESPVEVLFNQTKQIGGNSATVTCWNGIGYDSSSAQSGSIGYLLESSVTNVFIGTTSAAIHEVPNETIGIHTVYALELGGANGVFFGTADFMLVATKWMG